MQLPGPPSLAFLAYLLGVLPWMAFRSARRLRPASEASEGTPALPSRTTVWLSSLVNMGLMLLLAWMAGQSFGYDFGALPPHPGIAVLTGLGALAVCFALRAGARALWPPQARRSAVVYTLASRTPREETLRVAVMFAAAVAEEVAYRGVGWTILAYTLGNAWIAAGVSAVAFALAHWVQGWRSGLVILLIALVMHALVAFTGTLVVAIVVHVVFDLIAGALINREARRFDALDAGT